MSEPDVTAKPPLLRVVTGDPTPAELAALVALVAGWPRPATADVSAPHSEWGHPAHAVRQPLRLGTW